MMFGKNILILVPHPDDEVVACSASIKRAQIEGAKIFALYMTHGCVAKETMWPWQRDQYNAAVARRRAEAEIVAKQTGITPVGWSRRPARYVWRELPQVRDEIRDAIDAHNIDQIWVCAYEGGNADHDALNAVSSLFKNRLSILEFAEYNFADGKANSQKFPFPNKTEKTLDLTPQEEQRKRELLALYASEQKNLGYVDVMHECFRPLADYDYGQPPHPRTLWYARFQWVPFRHPRVDFTKPADVSAAITDFLKSNPAM